MSTATFFHDELDASQPRVILSPEEAQHARAARRLRAGSPVILLNGQGLRATGEITRVERREVAVQVDDFTQLERPLRSVTLLCAIPKGDRQRTMIDMLTQIGVTRIIALQCDYSVVRPDQRQHSKWQRYAIEACKQSGNPWLPEMAPSAPLSSIASVIDEYRFDRMFCAAQRGSLLAPQGKDATNVAAIIGPEGGFSTAEEALLEKHGIAALQLGQHILRTETATILAAAWCRGLTG